MADDTLENDFMHWVHRASENMVGAFTTAGEPLRGNLLKIHPSRVRDDLLGLYLYYVKEVSK